MRTNVKECLFVFMRIPHKSFQLIFFAVFDLRFNDVNMFFSYICTFSERYFLLRREPRAVYSLLFLYFPDRIPRDHFS